MIDPSDMELLAEWDKFCEYLSTLHRAERRRILRDFWKKVDKHDRELKRNRNAST